MATSFAAFASQYLNKNQASSSLSSSQPMFFSFTTDDGSRAGNDPDSDLDDLDDPHLRASGASISKRHEGDDEDDDPYLRLDEEDRLPGGSAARFASQSIPLISGSASPESPRAGWLAHQTSLLRSPSPSPSSSSADSTVPPSDLLRPTQAPSRYQPPPPPPPLTSRAPVSLSLTESLLPRDGTGRPIDVFFLPDPRHTPRARRKYNDSLWTSLYLGLLTVCLFCSILILFITHMPSSSPSSLPYTTLLHTVPLLTILTFASAAVAYGHVWLLRIFVKPVMIGTSVFIPATLFVSAIWAFVGSFMWEAGKEPTWGETVGLRLFSIIPLTLSLITARRLVHLPRQIHTTSSLLDLTTTLLLAHPLLLLLSPALLLASLLLSIPFITLIFRLLLVGAFGRGEWHVARGAGWAIAGVVGVWLWSWGVARGILRVTCAGVIGAWYFADPDLPPPPPTSTHALHAAVTRATSPSLGTIILSSLLLTLLRLLGLFVTLLRLLPYYLPPVLRPVATGASILAVYAENVTSTLSGYALIYVGLTGGPFFPSARRARALVAVADGGYKRRFKTEPPLTLLTIAPLTLAFPFALLTYLFVAHTLGAPESALGAAVMAGGVTCLVGKFCIGVVRDTADTLYVCYCIDKDVGERRRVEVFEAFEYDNRPQDQPQPITVRAPAPAPQHQQHRKPPAQQQQREPNFASPPREVQRAQPLSHSRAAPVPRPPSPDADVDPFTQSFEDDTAAQLASSAPHRDEEEEEEQLFPGSDFF